MNQAQLSFNNKTRRDELKYNKILSNGKRIEWQIFFLVLEV